MRNLLIATALFLASATPALAADPATLSCVREQLPPAAATALAESAKRRFSGASEEAVPADARAKLGEAAAACQKKHKWSDAATEAASQFTLTSIGRAAISELATTRGIKPADVQGAIDGMSAEEGAQLLKSESGGIMAFIRELQKRGVQMAQLEKDGEIYGALGAVILIERGYRGTFTAS